MRLGSKLLICLLIAGLGAGCTRPFFRKRADVEVEQVLHEKDVVPFWKIEQFHVYPDPRARFADPTNPDRPPMPPDDPTAYKMSPKAQKPGHAGVKRIEGKGYLTLMDAWDAHNRQMTAVKNGGEEESALADLARGVFHDKKKKGLPGAVEDVPPRPCGPDGKPLPYLLTLDQAVELGILNSREYQNRREDLYLLALPVTFERFGFAAQFFAIDEAVREHTGSHTLEGHGERWRNSGSAGFTKLFSTGALLLVQYANQTVINLGSSDKKVVSVGTINLDMVQPLLRGGGKAVTLEPLTQAERNLLYEIRDYARFRKVYYQDVTGGLPLVANLLSPGQTLGGAALIPGNEARIGSGNPARPQLTPTSPTRLLLGTGVLAPPTGFIPTLLARSSLEIEKQNYERLTGVLGLFRAYEGGGRVSSLQVGQVELTQLNSLARINTRQQAYRDALDNFKFQLGVPIDTPLEIDDELVRPVFRQFDRFETTIKQFNKIIADLENLDAIDEAPRVRAMLGKLLTDAPFVRSTKEFKVEFPKRYQAWQRDVLNDNALGEKLTRLRTERIKLLDEKLDKELLGETLPEKETQRLEYLNREVPTGELEAALRRFETMPWKNLPEVAKRDSYNARFRDVRIWFAEVLGEASNERLDLLRPQWPRPTPVIFDNQDLMTTDIDQGYETVQRIALENRLDLMNARAQAVDAWRQVAVHANALLGAFNVGYHLDSSTPPDEARPLAFAGSRTRHQLFLNFELPLVRMAERNAYRASLIGYQRARRALMSIEDNVVNQVRADLRNLQVLAKNYRIQQQAVELQYLQVESSLETFQAPPQPGGPGDNAGNAAALTQQLLNAYNGLPQQQLSLVSTWLAYQVARQQLYLDLEQLPLDERGVWIDEFNRLSDLGPAPFGNAALLPGLVDATGSATGVNGGQPTLGPPVAVLPGVLP